MSNIRAEGLFWAEICRGAENLAEALTLPPRKKLLYDPKINELKLTATTDEEIAGLDVSMNTIMSM